MDAEELAVGFAEIAVMVMVAAPSGAQPAKVRQAPHGAETRWAPLEVDRCSERLAATGWRRGRSFVRRPRLQKDRKRGYDTLYCYVPQQLMVRRGPTGIWYKGYTTFNCAMALAMARFERIAQEEARRHFKTKRKAPILSITHRGTYNCRRLRRRWSKQSEHSFANALDIKSFRVAGFGRVSIERHWSSTRKRHQRARKFLRALSKRLKNEHVFSNVLDPDYDRWHHDHFHVDLAKTKRGRPSEALRRAKAMPTKVAKASKRGTKRSRERRRRR